jgi:arylsulfatase A-like enzyme
MCGEGTPSQGGGFASADLSRRNLLRAGGAGLLFSAAAGVPSGALAATGKKRAYVIVVDGCKPQEITTSLTPNLASLRATGTNFPRARSLPVMETIPNHTMMMTGVRPDRSGVPANKFWDGTELRDMDRPTDMKYPTVLQRLKRAGFTTGSVLSKEYLYGIFGERATYRWEPTPIVPVSGHAPDVFTMEAALAMLGDFDPNMMFINLGDIDRMGHADITGTTLEAARTAALADTDVQVGRFIDELKASGRWKNSLVLVLADHSMDWSTPDAYISLGGAFDADPLLADNFQIAQNGGAELLYWTGAADQRAAAVAKMSEIALATEGVLSTHSPASLRLGPAAGDLVVYCKAGWRFTDPDPSANPIPGNHGHPATLPIPFFINGGASIVRHQFSSTAPARTMDVAPTIGKFFGLSAPRGGYDGTARI